MDSLRSSGTSDRDVEGGRAGTHRIDGGRGGGNVSVECPNRIRQRDPRIEMHWLSWRSSGLRKAFNRYPTLLKRIQDI